MQSQSKDNFHLLRHFCEYTKKDNIVSEGGLIYVPEKNDSFFDGNEVAWPRSWDYYANYQSIVLLGPPRQGKTSEFKYQCEQAENGFFLPLREVTNPKCLEEAFDTYTKKQWANWLESNQNGELFIDSLDEGNLEIKKLSLQIIRWLKKLGTHVLKRLRIHLSCREADWFQSDENKWNELFSVKYDEQGEQNQKYIVLSLLNLSLESVCAYCTHFEVDENIFLKDIPPSAKSFIQRPQTLKMLLDYYKDNKQYITNTRDLYESAIERQLQEDNEEHQQYSPLAKRNLPEKRKIAEYYAVTTILCGREIIAKYDIDSHKHILSGSSKTSSEAEESVFKSPLFEPFTNGQYRFNQPDIANYLAAYYLNTLIKEQSVQIKRLLHLFFPSTHTNEPVPRLRDLIAWLCNFNKEFRHEIFDKNPSIILHEYYDISFTDEDRLTIWQWVKQYYGELDWFNDRWLMPYCGTLACEAIIPKLKEVFTQQFGNRIRELALVIIEKGKLKGFSKEIITILNDQHAKLHLRRFAIYALAQAEPEQTPILKKLLNLPKEQDPENRLFWAALSCLWPNYVDFNTLLAYLRSDKDRTFHYLSFIDTLPKRLSVDECTQILDNLAQSLTEALHQNKKEEKYAYQFSGLERYFGNFLFVQLEAWKDKPEKVPNLESWLMVYEKACKHDLYYGEFEVTKKIQQLIDVEPHLRHKICCYRIQRLYREKNNDFKPSGILSSINVTRNINYIKKDDLSVWQKTLLDWSSKELPLLEAIWRVFYYSWHQADYSPEILEWLEEKSLQYPNLAKIWEAEKVCPYDYEIESRKWDYKHRERMKKYQQERNQKLTGWIKYIQENVEKLKNGDEKILYHLTGIPPEANGRKLSFEKRLKTHLGNDVFDAYQTGLYTYWQNSEITDIDNKHPWRATFVVHAVTVWKGKQNGSDITRDMRHKALQAGLFSLTLPKWYQEVALIEQEYVHELFNKHFNIDLKKTENSLIVYHLTGLDEPFFYGIAYHFINEHPECRVGMLIPLLRYIIDGNPSEDKIKTLWQHAETSIRSDEERGLFYFAAVWRFHPSEVWQWLECNFLNHEKRASQFEGWISIIEQLHLERGGTIWSHWVNERALLAMIPDFFTTYPPETDPTTDEFNSGKQEIQQRQYRADLRRDTLYKVAASGEILVKNQLEQMLQNPQMQPYREYLCAALEQWQHAHAERSWTPLEQEELWKTLTKNAHPVKTHEDLFDLVCEIITDVKKEISAGEDNLKAMLWENRTAKKEKWKPATEENLQILIANQIKKHSILQKQRIVVGRELEVGGNRPDIFMTCILPNGERAKVYIEIKRQQHSELLTAIREQLAEKYLGDSEARYGIFLVGWYGSNHSIGAVNKLTKECGKKPEIAQELEECLQYLCDEVARNQIDIDIDDLKAIVIDVSQNK